jgi:hypothetical protein
MVFTKVDQIFSNRLPVLVSSKNMPLPDGATLFSSWFATGSPAPVNSSPGVNGVALTYTGTQGELPVTNSGGGKDLKLVQVNGNSRNGGFHLLCDRLWHNSGLSPTTITEQVISSPALPSRDINGQTLGEGVIAALEFSTAATNAAAIANTTLNFTDSDGTAARVGNLVVSIPATANVNTMSLFNWGTGGARGVRSIQGLTLGTSLVTGTISLVLLRPLAMWHSLNASSHQSNCGGDAFGLCAPTIPPGAVLFTMYNNNATSAAIVHNYHMTFAEA